MELNKLPNIDGYWIDGGYLNFKLHNGDRIRLNFNDIEALKKQVSLDDVGSNTEELEYCNKHKWDDCDCVDLCRRGLSIT